MIQDAFVRQRARQLYWQGYPPAEISRLMGINPGCSGGEIAAALNTPTTAINAELRRLWRSGSVIRKERKTGGRFSYQINPMPFGCGNPLTNMFNQLLKEARA